jgi:hypothetical protein
MSTDTQQTSEPSDRTTAGMPPTGRWRCFSRRRAPPDPSAIRNARFTNELATLTSLKTLLLTQGVRIRDEDVGLLSFGELNRLRYDEKGRQPTIEEWERLDNHSRRLFSYLDEAEGLRTRFELSQTANLISGLSVVFIVVALISLMGAILGVDRNAVLLGCYFSWTGSLGAIGAIAFLSMNALSIQKDVTFDLTNKSLLAVRIVLGALFGIVLSIPFGFYGFIEFSEAVARGIATQRTTTFSLGSALPLLLPFVLGFSTSVVILVLNKFLASITVFFGGRDSSGSN